MASGPLPPAPLQPGRAHDWTLPIQREQMCVIPEPEIFKSRGTFSCSFFSWVVIGFGDSEVLKAGRP